MESTVTNQANNITQLPAPTAVTPPSTTATTPAAIPAEIASTKKIMAPSAHVSKVVPEKVTVVHKAGDIYYTVDAEHGIVTASVYGVTEMAKDAIHNVLGSLIPKKYADAMLLDYSYRAKAKCNLIDGDTFDEAYGKRLATSRLNIKVKLAILRKLRLFIGLRERETDKMIDAMNSYNQKVFSSITHHNEKYDGHRHFNIPDLWPVYNPNADTESEETE